MEKREVGVFCSGPSPSVGESTAESWCCNCRRCWNCVRCCNISVAVGFRKGLAGIAFGSRKVCSEGRCVVCEDDENLRRICLQPPLTACEARDREPECECCEVGKPVRQPVEQPSSVTASRCIGVNVCDAVRFMVESKEVPEEDEDDDDEVSSTADDVFGRWVRMDVLR